MWCEQTENIALIDLTDNCIYSGIDTNTDFHTHRHNHITVAFTFTWTAILTEAITDSYRGIGIYMDEGQHR